MWGAGFLFMLFFWILIIVVIASLVHCSSNLRRGGCNMEKTPLQILQERYAKGEIDKKEYEEKKKDLS
jgi:putative membrane protein